MTSSQPDDRFLHFTRIAERVDIAHCWRSWDAAPEMWLVDTSRQRKVRCQRNTRNIFLARPGNRFLPARRMRTTSMRAELPLRPESSPVHWRSASVPRRRLDATLGRANPGGAATEESSLSARRYRCLLPGPRPSPPDPEELAGKPALRGRRDCRDAPGESSGRSTTRPVTRRTNPSRRRGFTSSSTCSPRPGGGFMSCRRAM